MPPPTPVPTVTSSGSATSSPAPKVNSPQAAAFASFSTTTGSPMRASRSLGRRLVAPGQVRGEQHRRAARVHEARRPDADRRDVVAAAQLGDQVLDVRSIAVGVRRRRLAGARSRGSRPSRRPRRRRSWCRPRRCRRSRPISRPPTRRRRRGRSSRPGRPARPSSGRAPGSPAAPAAACISEVAAAARWCLHLRAGAPDRRDHLAHRAVAAVLAAGRDVLVDVGDVGRGARPPPARSPRRTRCRLLGPVLQGLEQLGGLLADTADGLVVAVRRPASIGPSVTPARPEPDPQRAVVDARTRDRVPAQARRAARAAVGRNRRSPRARLRVVARSMSDLATNGSAMPQHGARPGAGDRHRAAPPSAARAGRRRRTPPRRSRRAPRRRPAPRPVRRTATPAARRTTARPPRAPRPAPRPSRRATRRRPRSGKTRLATDPVDAVAEQRQRGERAARLGHHDGLGGEHQPHAGVRPGQQRAAPPRGRACSRSTASNTESCGIGTPAASAQHRPQRLDDAALGREHPVHVPAERLRQGQQPQRLGGRARSRRRPRPTPPTAPGRAARAAPAPPRRPG